MKSALLLPLAAAFVLSSFSVSAQAKPAKTEETKAKVKTKNVKMKVKGNLSAVPLPYTVGYSSQFIIGDPVYAKTVLDIWKDFDDNAFGRNGNSIADTVVMHLADGTVLRGLQEVMESAKSYRSSLASAETSVSAILSAHSIDKDEDWVLLWRESKETDKSGNTRTMVFHESWRLNKDGKVDLMMQYANSASNM